MRLPFLPTLVVAAAVAAMVGLGIWQLQRADWKEALIARLEEARTLAPVELEDAEAPGLQYRRASAHCSIPRSRSQLRGGRSRAGQPGFVHLASCLSAGRPLVTIDAGWSAGPDASVAIEASGPFTGMLRKPGNWEGIDTGLYVLVLDRPLAGLGPSAQPGVDAIPNNHRLYAVQWFFFAAAAILIYGLALRRGLQTRQERPGV
ncbi:SURF1 family protein [Sphingosinicella rhizophila]|uniref:SURF1-like protein n=1 Tax=Sphingosinicella rhizophila TaxID=3050082 RepID=A0ABU3Q8X9_9SPHN|nr:SURF1 family protein [Sphingosinicella sp. GR2756]MDT9599395.1 SURF1 family protein [Sphingosinicella sp. GR2756]